MIGRSEIQTAKPNSLLKIRVTLLRVKAGLITQNITPTPKTRNVAGKTSLGSKGSFRDLDLAINITYRSRVMKNEKQSV